MGKIHARNVWLDPDFQLLYVVDPIIELAEKISRNYGCLACPNINDALADENVDFIIIASTTDAHEEQVLACASTRKAFLCEKPIASSLKSALNCVHAVESNNCHSAMGFNRRLDEEYRFIRQEVHSGRIGSVETMHLVSRSFNKSSVTPKLFSSGMIREKGTHFFDLSSWILGFDPVETYATGAKFKGSRGDDSDFDTATVVVRYENEVIVSFNFNQKAKFGQDEFIEIVGTDGMILTGRSSTGDTKIFTDKGIFQKGIHQSWYKRFQQTYTEELKLLVETSAQKKLKIASLRDGLKAQAIAEASIESMIRKQLVKIEKVW